MTLNDFLQNDLTYFRHNRSNFLYNDFELHCHSHYELFFLFSGDVDYRVEGKEYKLAPHSLLLISPNLFHGVKVNSTHDYYRLSVHFSNNLLPQSLQKLILTPFHQDNIYYPNISRKGTGTYIKSVLDCLALPPEVQSAALSSSVCSLLYHIHYLSGSNTEPLVTGDFRITQILEYINRHISDPLTLKGIAQRFFISENHLNVIFKETTGTTVGSYINIKRVTLANQMILEGIPAKNAALETGFGHYSNFYRNYTKHFGHSPSKSTITVSSNN